MLTSLHTESEQVSKNAKVRNLVKVEGFYDTLVKLLTFRVDFFLLCSKFPCFFFFFLAWDLSKLIIIIIIVKHDSV